MVEVRKPNCNICARSESRQSNFEFFFWVRTVVLYFEETILKHMMLFRSTEVNHLRHAIHQAAL